MNANSALLDDPQRFVRRLAIQERDGSAQQRQDIRYTLRVWSQYPDAWILGRWIPANVCEVGIECNEDPALATGDFEHVSVRRSAQLFTEGSLDIVTGGEKQRLGIARKILIQLELPGHEDSLYR